MSSWLLVHVGSLDLHTSVPSVANSSHEIVEHRNESPYVERRPGRAVGRGMVTTMVI